MSWKSILAGMFSGLIVGTLTLFFYWSSAPSERLPKAILFIVVCGLGPGIVAGILASGLGNVAARKSQSDNRGILVAALSGIVLGLISASLGIALSVFALPK